MTSHRNIWLGVGCGLLAGAFWGLVFLAPELASDFSPLELAAGRYLAYGAFAVALLAPRWRSVLAHLGRREWLALSGLSLLGNTLYYVLLAGGVQMGGVAMTSVVIGFLPVMVTTIGAFDHGAVRLRKLAPSLVLGAAAVACIGWQSLRSAADGAHPQAALGLLCATGALASWTAYAVLNGRWLAKLDHISAGDWSLLTGVATGAQAVVLALLAAVVVTGVHDAPAWARFLAVSAGVALFASIVGNALWNHASRLLPMTLVGQMIVFETLFALTYGFLWEARAPTLAEAAAIALMLASVLTCVSAHRKPEFTHA
ncbi:DMT family transporter [Phenylobacterium sp.]|uniref:DMT family transporter n=1 Tax=Phenylobacterium sp. TaxID=1871053 RepID=UPI0035B2292F